jgi:hypothetical protein
VQCTAPVSIDLDHPAAMNSSILFSQPIFLSMIFLSSSLPGKRFVAASLGRGQKDGWQKKLLGTRACRREPGYARAPSVSTLLTWDLFSARFTLHGLDVFLAFFFNLGRVGRFLWFSSAADLAESHQQCPQENHASKRKQER